MAQGSISVQEPFSGAETVRLLHQRILAPGIPVEEVSLKQLGLIVFTIICWLAALPGAAQETHEHQQAAIFHALALLGTAPPSDATYALQKRGPSCERPEAKRAKALASGG